MALDKHRKPKQLKNSNGLYILLEAVYWTYNIAYLPIKVRMNNILQFLQYNSERISVS